MKPGIEMPGHFQMFLQNKLGCWLKKIERRPEINQSKRAGWKAVETALMGAEK
jgi:hypothetical protein